MALAFRPVEDFAASPSTYRFLPVRFERLRDERVVLTNLVGEFAVLTRDRFSEFVSRRPMPSCQDYLDLKARHFLIDSHGTVATELLAIKARTQASSVADFTGLHMFVVTLRCDHSCVYCQVSRQTADKKAFDMSAAHAEKALDFVFSSSADLRRSRGARTTHSWDYVEDEQHSERRRDQARRAQSNRPPL